MSVEKHLVEDAEAVLSKTKKLKVNEVQEANNLFTRWFYWSKIFLGDLDISDGRINYFLTAYMESCREAQSSIVLALHGSYKNAVQILRNWLELMIAGIYYDHHQSEGQRWLEKGHYVRFKLFKSKLQSEKVLSNQTVEEVSKAWEKLSVYVHSLARVLEGTYAKSAGAVLPEYNQEYFDEWFKLLVETYTLCCFLLVEHIPEVLSSKEIDHFLKPSVMEILKERIADK